MKQKIIFKISGEKVKIDYLKDYVEIDASVSPAKNMYILLYLQQEGFLDTSLIKKMKKLNKK